MGAPNVKTPPPAESLIIPMNDLNLDYLDVVRELDRCFDQNTTTMGARVLCSASALLNVWYYEYIPFLNMYALLCIALQSMCICSGNLMGNLCSCWTRRVLELVNRYLYVAILLYLIQRTWGIGRPGLQVAFHHAEVLVASIQFGLNQNFDLITSLLSKRLYHSEQRFLTQSHKCLCLSPLQNDQTLMSSNLNVSQSWYLPERNGKSCLLDIQ